MRKYLDGDGLSYLWTQIKRFFADKVHYHESEYISDVTFSSNTLWKKHGGNDPESSASMIGIVQLADVATSGDYDDLTNKPTIPTQPSDIGAQEELVSGTNIKTVNGNSLLGSGNINIQGSGGGAFIAEYGVTTYAAVKDAYDEDATIICAVDDSGNTAICQLAYFDDANDTFIFAQPVSEGWYWASIASDDTWDDGRFQFAPTDTATQLRDGLMSALDWQKLDGIASGAEVNVQSDWNEADSTDDAYIKNKPTIPSKTSDLNNDSGFLTAETDPVFAASAAHGITSSDISAWNGKSDFSGDYDDLTNKPSLATVATSGDYDDLDNTPSLATVATSGSYNDLSDKPTIIETGTSGGWEYRKYSDGHIEAEKDITTGSSWTAVGTSGVYYNATTITPPTGMTVKSGYANLKSVSQYIIGTQVQIGSTINLEVHRLASGSASFTCHVTIIGS